MMAEVLLEGEETQSQHLQDGHSEDVPERTFRLPLDFSPCSLSSAQAATKTARTNCQRDCRREERQNISVEPLTRNSWFSGGPVVHAPGSGWSSNIQIVSQVVRETTQENPVVKPPAAPRWSIGVLTSSTSPPAESGKKPQKPLRTSLPKSPEKKLLSERRVKVGPKTAFTVTEDQSDVKSDVKKAKSSQTCTRSVTICWNIPSDPPVAAVSTFSKSKNSHQPVPRPRTKLNNPSSEDARVQNLVKLAENLDNFPFDSQEDSTNKYLQDLLEVLSKSDDFVEDIFIVDQSDKLQDEDADGKMSNNQQNFRARIQAFESQADAEEGNASQMGTPNLPPRRASFRPPVAAKPSAAFRSTSLDDTNKNEPTAQNPQNPFTGSKAQTPVKPVRQSLRNEPEAFHSKGNTSNSPNPFALTSSDGFEEEEPSLMPPIPPLKPFKEPLKPNLNINNHNSASMFTNNNHLDNPFSNPPVKPQFSMDGDGFSANRPSIVKRPTTIRVPSMTGSGNFQDSGHPLPTQKPMSPLNPSVSYKQITKSSMSLQNSFGISPTPLLPPRKPTMEKSLPPRPPLAKAGPRPFPPTLQAADQSQSKPPTYLAQMPPKKGLLLPPRPCPGHRLYNKYTLQLPHGIASFDYDGSDSGQLSLQKNEVLVLLGEINRDEFECQVGEAKGRVHISRMKVITPLDTPPLQGASGGDDYGLTVQALYDFNPENPGELRLREGDVVTDVEQLDNQWYQGTRDGSTGYFPVSYAKVLSNSPKSLPKKKTKPKPAKISGPRCVAMFNFDGEHSDELSFSEGEVIQLKELVGEDWARGQIGTSIGIFPLNFVDVIENLPPSRSQLQSSKVSLPGMAASPSMQSEAAKPVQASKPSVEWATALYDYAAKSADELSFQQGDRILITNHINEDWSSGRLGGREGMFPRAFIEASTGQAAAGAAGGERARSLYSYTSDCEEELSIRVGDIITNLESVDEEWFLGDLRGRRALVPKNYVQVLK